MATYGAVHCRTRPYGDMRVCRMRRRTQHERALRHCKSPYIDVRGLMATYCTSTCGRCRRTAPYARLTQATQGPKHASNLTHVILHDKFQPLLENVAFLAFHALHCLLLEIALNAGSAYAERHGPAPTHALPSYERTFILVF